MKTEEIMKGFKQAVTLFS